MTASVSNIVITGAAGGLGSALSLACAGQGARLLLIDKDLRGLEKVCDQVESSGGPAPAYCQLDLARAGPPDCQELVDGFVAEYGKLDGLAHCAVHFSGLSPLDQVRGDEWLESMQVNVNTPWLLTMKCLPSLRAEPGGTVIFVLDEPGRSESAYWGPYGVSKSAVRSLAAMLAEELEGTNCRVFGVDPGPMRTGMRAAAYMAEDPKRVPAPSVPADYLASLLLRNEPGSPVIHRAPAD